MKKTMTTYQLLNANGETSGVIETDASEAIVTEIYKAVHWENLTETQKDILRGENAEDEADSEKVVILLENAGYDVERIWITEIYA